MAEIKTKANLHSLDLFLNGIEHPVRRADADQLIALMHRISGEPPIMWGPSIIGFGAYHYRYESGHSGEMCRIGFSPRKAHQVLYLLTDGQEALITQLGKIKRNKGCLYVNKLTDIDLAVLEELVAASWNLMAQRHPL